MAYFIIPLKTNSFKGELLKSYIVNIEFSHILPIFCTQSLHNSRLSFLFEYRKWICTCVFMRTFYKKINLKALIYFLVDADFCLCSIISYSAGCAPWKNYIVYFMCYFICPLY